MHNMNDTNVWTKVPYKIKYEYGFFWFGVLFLLLLSIKSCEKYLLEEKFKFLLMSILFIILFLSLLYKRFIKTTAIFLTEEGIKIYPLLKKPYFIPWYHIERFGLGYRGFTKYVYFIYKKEFEKNKFFFQKSLPIFAYKQSNFKRLQLTHQKYKNQIY
jgi:hypothetical protein